MNGSATDGTVYSRTGSGPAVALIHGLGLNRAMWQWLLPDLSPGFQALTYDLYGHGASPPPPREPDLALFSEQLLRLMDECGIDRAAIVGFSLGGMIARRFALDHPDRLSALAILHSPHDRTTEEREAVRMRVRQARASGPSSTAEAALERWFTGGFRNAHPEIPGLVRDWILANDPAVYPHIYHVLAEGDAELATAIRTIACPTLVMTGDEDHGNSPRMAERMAALMGDARTVILPGLRHMALAESPATFNAPLLAFLEETLDGESG